MATDKLIEFIPEEPGTHLAFNAGSGFAVNPGTGSDAFAAAQRNIIITVVGTGNIKVYGSAQELPPNFNAASTIDNSYTPIILADYSTQAIYYNGSVGVTVAGATKIVELNTNMLTWIAIKRSVDTVQVLVTISDNQ